MNAVVANTGVFLNEPAHRQDIIALAAADRFNRLAKDASLDKEKVRDILRSTTEKGLFAPDSFVLTVAGENGGVAAVAIARKSAWDTEVLEREIWNLEQVFLADSSGNNEAVWRKLMQRVADEKRQRDIDLLIYRVDTEQFTATNAALWAGFRLMETIQYMSKDLSDVANLAISSGVMVRFAREEDVQPIINSCKGIFTASRLNKEAQLDGGLVDKMYETWIGNAYKDPQTFFHVAEVDGKIAGFWLNKLQYDEAILGRKLYVGRLTAVFPGFRGKGIMKNLAIHSAQTFAGDGVYFDGSAVVENLPSINTMISLKFKSVYTFHTLHL